MATKLKKPTRGHWPRGKRRHDVPGWPSTLKGLRLAVRDRISRRELARRVGVSDHTVRRWLAGEDLPAPKSAAKVRRVLAKLFSTAELTRAGRWVHSTSR